MNQNLVHGSGPIIIILEKSCHLYMYRNRLPRRIHSFIINFIYTAATMCNRSGPSLNVWWRCHDHFCAVVWISQMLITEEDGFI